ncbi:HTR-like protein [Halovenus sp. WSH3]|uniref:HTR-like protein n=1 Tax=Halovenus carboxidivorans TaxID=2692199 RepID=A0A6B0T5R5_9EURY|nr:HTR-like protein [Halovenus carboxidivorans]MXR50903.1 HTR-like protein [Halovenus carboxidivorans]
MERLPFGINRLDNTIGGGAPRGSVVLLSGEAGAGAREFMFTTAVMNGLASVGHDTFDLHYGDLSDNATLPEEIHYVSFTAEEDQLRNEIAMTMDEEIADSGLESVEFESLSKNFFHVSPVPRDWYAEETTDITSLRKRHEDREGLLSALGGTLNDRAPGNLVVIDSLSDLVSTVGDDEGMQWSDVSYIVKGLEKASYNWGGLILVHVNHETLTDTQHGQLIDACSGTLQFEWETGGSNRARTLVVKNFRGVLSQIEAENIVKFETDFGDAGFDISDVRKIR